MFQSERVFWMLTNVLNMTLKSYQVCCDGEKERYEILIKSIVIHIASVINDMIDNREFEKVLMMDDIPFTVEFDFVHKLLCVSVELEPGKFMDTCFTMSGPNSIDA